HELDVAVRVHRVAHRDAVDGDVLVHAELRSARVAGAAPRAALVAREAVEDGPRDAHAAAALRRLLRTNVAAHSAVHRVGLHARAHHAADLLARRAAQAFHALLGLHVARRPAHAAVVGIRLHVDARAVALRLVHRTRDGAHAVRARPHATTHDRSRVGAAADHPAFAAVGEIGLHVDARRAALGRAHPALTRSLHAGRTARTRR